MIALSSVPGCGRDATRSLRYRTKTLVWSHVRYTSLDDNYHNSCHIRIIITYIWSSILFFDRGKLLQGVLVLAWFRSRLLEQVVRDRPLVAVVPLRKPWRA